MCFGGGGSSRTALSARTSALQRRGSTATAFDKVYDFGKPQTLTRYVTDPNYVAPAPAKVSNPLGGFGGSTSGLPLPFQAPRSLGGFGFGGGPRISSKNPAPPKPAIVNVPKGSTNSLGGFGGSTVPAGYKQETKTITNAADYKAFTGKDFAGTYNYVGRTINGNQGRVAIADEGKLRRATRQARTNTSIIQGNAAIKRSRRGGLRIDSSSSQLPSGGSGVNVPV